jgi:glycosyltransferase involved in cell wall biosynthesis
LGVYEDEGVINLNMNIIMATNTYLPHVGGVARSVERFTLNYRRMGHPVMIIAPEFEGLPGWEEDVIRIPAVRNFRESGFSVALPLPFQVTLEVNRFNPDVVHSHHPYLLGNMAQRIAASRELPVVFTYHTMYEKYTHYVVNGSIALKRFAVELSKRYANLCDHVIAPSDSIAGILRKRGVEVPITVIPSGVDVDYFGQGDGQAIRRTMCIPQNAFVIGLTGRLAPEKNLDFLARCVARSVEEIEDSYFLVVGEGPSRHIIEKTFDRDFLRERIKFTGALTGRRLVDAYHAMDLFAFASRTETQGMVLVEAMACGLPVVALDAPGVSEVVRDQVDGRLVRDENPDAFVAGIRWIYDRPGEERQCLMSSARHTARSFSTERCAAKALGLYQEVIAENKAKKGSKNSAKSMALRALEKEWELWAERLGAAAKALFG